MLIINEVKLNNQQMFEENNKAMKDHEEVAACNQQLEEAITKACNELPELQIPEEATSEKRSRSWKKWSRSQRKRWERSDLSSRCKL